MRIFLPGATDSIGAAVLDSLVRAGHDVTALVRHKEKARRVAKRGGHPIVGDLTVPESYRDVLEGQYGYVYAAFDSPSGRALAIERTALETILAAARRPRTAGPGTPPRFVIYTSGIWTLRPATAPPPATAPINQL